MAIWLIRAGSHDEYEQEIITKIHVHLRPFQKSILQIL